MYLLNRQQILAAIERKDLDIWYLIDERLEHSYYYFTLSPEIEMHDRDGVWKPEILASGVPLTLTPGQCVRVKSFESFSLSARIFALLGSTTDLVLRGLVLQHGLTMDPLYPRAGRDDVETYGPLRMTLVNNASCDEEVRWGDHGDKIGKICFFDISDTYPVKPSEKAAEQYQERSEPVG